ncbi:OLC1v1029611C1 [Oldenlandia corymbosa var. corymbosa]|uniref:OLC1v1029611C1 n=1 Tax=Oldenlandia corymbosa var. corymbosa TaxID=529605 RepID=A0AAV1CG13_OLDCO|nr:OLC1v1029611C1 [Oldenlandia corymbosa var. corymbosa]
MPLDLVVEIAKRISLVEDFMALRGVCISWRAAATLDKFTFRLRAPLLMLAYKHEGDHDHTEHEFYSLAKRKICMRLSMPEIKYKQCTDVGFGWFLGFWRPGNVAWRRIDMHNVLYWCVFEHVKYYKGKFYALNNWGDLRICDDSSSGSTAPVLFDINLLPYRKLYLVESSFGELLLILRVDNDGRPNRYHYSRTFKVYGMRL